MSWGCSLTTDFLFGAISDSATPAHSLPLHTLFLSSTSAFLPPHALPKIPKQTRDRTQVEQQGCLCCCHQSQCQPGHAWALIIPCFNSSAMFYRCQSIQIMWQIQSTFLYLKKKITTKYKRVFSCYGNCFIYKGLLWFKKPNHLSYLSKAGKHWMKESEIWRDFALLLPYFSSPREQGHKEKFLFNKKLVTFNVNCPWALRPWRRHQKLDWKIAFSWEVCLLPSLWWTTKEGAKLMPLKYHSLHAITLCHC